MLSGVKKTVGGKEPRLPITFFVWLMYPRNAHRDVPVCVCTIVVQLCNPTSLLVLNPSENLK